MAAQIKYLIFKGIEKKEQILFKSFLNLAKNELDYQVVILKPDHENVDDSDIMIADVSYELNESEGNLKGLPTILVGNEDDDQAENYIRRPVQWSDFKDALSQLDIQIVEDDEPVERVLPSEIKFAITEMVGDTTMMSVNETDDDSENDYDYELGKMSVDYHSVTDSDYVKVVDDVKQFKDPGAGQEDAEPQEAVILITDDESTSQNSVLVIETNTVDAWDFTQSEASVGSADQDYKQDPDDDDDDEGEVVLEKKAGLDIAPGEQYWLADNELIVDHETLLYIKSVRSMVYSSKEPGRWTNLLMNGTLTKIPLPDSWRPTRELKAYPLSNFVWVNTLISDTGELADDLDEKTEYMLEKWPDFDLIQLDNSLLKLCTMMFVRPETVDSLISKSGYSHSTVIGLINACHSMQLIKKASEFSPQQVANVGSDDGMLGKIKDVFR